MSKEVMKQALEALKYLATQIKPDYEHSKAIKALEEALAKQEQGEPVAWIEHHKGGDNLNWEEFNHPYAKATPLYTKPSQKPWVGLTDEEAQWLYDNCRTQSNLIDMTEAKLKEKNT